MSFTVLLTCVGGELSPQVIQLLKSSVRHDVKVIGVDAKDNATGRYFVDSFATVPNGNDPSYTEQVAELVSMHNVDLVLPTSDEEAVVLAHNRTLIENQGCQLACTSADVLGVIANKATAYERFAELGLPVPLWRRTDSLDQISPAIDEIVEITGQAVVKPAGERGGRGVFVVRNDLVGAHPIDGGREIHLDAATFKSDYLQSFEPFLPAMVMERLKDPVYDVDMLAWKGEAHRVVARRRVDSALPNAGHTFVENAELVDLGETLIEKLELSWLYDCDVMYDHKGRPGILEINPRPSGSVATTIVAGVPLLDDMVSLAKGEPLPEIESPAGKVVVPWQALEVVSS
jgi:carbamoylphosphate synthase large subunit